MVSPPNLDLSGAPWTLKKAVTALAIAPQTEDLTRTGRQAYNVLIYLAQHTKPDDEGGFSAPLSQVIKSYEGTTRDAPRVRTYLEQMCATVVRWFPLSKSDEQQGTLIGIESPPPDDAAGEGRIFTLLSEVRFYKRSGEQWITWFFSPSVRELLIEPSRWAEIDIKEMAQLSTYAGVALYEICARYRNVPGGLTNKEAPEFWVAVLRAESDSKPREWRKFKSETLKPAIAEINLRTGLDVQLVEYRQGRGVSAVQFTVKRKQAVDTSAPVDLSLVELATSVGLKERELDSLVDEFDEAKVKKGLLLLQGRMRAQPSVPVNHKAAYLRKTLKTSLSDSLFPDANHAGELPPETMRPLASIVELPPVPMSPRNKLLAELRVEVQSMSDEQLEVYAKKAFEAMVQKKTMTPPVHRRFLEQRFQSPIIREQILLVIAEERFGEGWEGTPAASGDRREG